MVPYACLVPSEMTKPAFWLRFFFRTHQIRLEEEKRKALLQSVFSLSHSYPFIVIHIRLGSIENEDDFSWEDEEEESSPTATKHAQAGQSTSATSVSSHIFSHILSTHLKTTGGQEAGKRRSFSYNGPRYWRNDKSTGE